MDDEEIEDMEKEINDEEEQGIGGPTIPPEQQAAQQAEAEQYPPEDNTQEAGSTESLTPQLDADVKRYSSILNKQ